MWLPERIEGDGIVLRRWRVEDAAAMQRAVTASAEHLRPWMAWMAAEPLTLAARQAMLAQWDREWDGEVMANWSIRIDGAVAGSIGLMTRQGPTTMEIGYWVAASASRRGVASEASRLLTDVAFRLPHIESVEIHHDAANVASEGVPRRLGFTLAGERRTEPAAPADEGVDRVWRISREQWRQRGQGRRDAAHLESGPRPE